LQGAHPGVVTAPCHEPRSRRCTGRQPRDTALGPLIVDAHIHVGRWKHADFLGRACTLDDAIAALEAAGCGGGLVMPTDELDNAGLLAEVEAAAGRGVALWTIAWLEPGESDLDWVEGNAAKLTGIKLHPSLSRCRVTDDRFRPALEVAADNDLIILVHCGRWQEMASYSFALDAAEELPEARFVLAHAGGDTPPLATAAAEQVAARGLDNVWFDFSGLREFWVIERNVARIGADRYLMGSDFSLAHPLMYVGAVRGMALSESDRERLLGGNARALLGEPLVRGCP
jgi:predicted TIM-barrel fold metal-dependent hydrolase